MYSSLAEKRVRLRERPGPRVNLTAKLTSLSDWMFSPLVARAAGTYSDAIQTPSHFIEMLFLVEDKRFPIHIGVDPIAIVRAIAFNLRRGQIQGASTLTQQVFTVRIARSKGVTRSLTYKLGQSLWALGQSVFGNRASLLREYVETVYWGRSYYGLDRAVEGYFGKSRALLSVAQSFFLAERIAAPNRVSRRRISNLLDRMPIKTSIARNGATIQDVRKVYEQVYGRGGETWQIPAR